MDTETAMVDRHADGVGRETSRVGRETGRVDIHYRVGREPRG